MDKDRELDGNFMKEPCKVIRTTCKLYAGRL